MQYNKIKFTNGLFCDAYQAIDEQKRVVAYLDEKGETISFLDENGKEIVVESEFHGEDVTPPFEAKDVVDPWLVADQMETEARIEARRAAEAAVVNTESEFPQSNNQLDARIRKIIYEIIGGVPNNS